MTMYSMHYLLVRELQDLYGAEQPLTKALPTMAGTSTVPLLTPAVGEDPGRRAEPGGVLGDGRAAERLRLTIEG